MLSLPVMKTLSFHSSLSPACQPTYCTWQSCGQDEDHYLAVLGPGPHPSPDGGRRWWSEGDGVMDDAALAAQGDAGSRYDKVKAE